jgi:hypothetical protein
LIFLLNIKLFSNKDIYILNKAEPMTFYKKSELKPELQNIELREEKQGTMVTINNLNIFLNVNGNSLKIVRINGTQFNSIKSKQLSQIKMTMPQATLINSISVKGNKNGYIKDLDTFSNDKSMVPLRIEPINVLRNSNILIPTFTKNHVR